MRLTRVGVVLGSAVTAAALLAGCSSSATSRTTPAANTATVTTTAPVPSVAASGATSTPTPGDTGATGTTPPAVSTGSPAAAGPGLCTPTVTRLTVTPASGGDNHVGVEVHVVNASSSPCATTGYPGVAQLDAGGRQVAQATRTPSGYLGGLAAGASPARLVLQPGEQATALLEGLNGNPSGPACATSPAVLVTLPDNTDATTLPTTTPVCQDLQIHPLIAGSSGGAGT